VGWIKKGFECLGIKRERKKEKIQKGQFKQKLHSIFKLRSAKNAGVGHSTQRHIHSKEMIFPFYKKH
jgi:hypothetical protein